MSCSTVLKTKGYKLTPQRKVILDILHHTGVHLTADDIYLKVKERIPGVNRSTVYRTLDLLARLGLVCRVHAGDSSRSYLLRRPEGHHHHLICSGCGKVVSLVGCNLAPMLARVSRQTGFEIEYHLVELVGRCRDCQGGSL